MENILSFIYKPLKRYDSVDYIIRQKIKALYSVILAIMVILPVVVLISIFIVKEMPVISFYALGVTWLINLLSLLLVIRGYYFISSHITLLATFSLIWVILFFQSDEHLLYKLDTLFFLFTLLSLVPLLLTEKIWQVVLYYALNFFLFIVYILFLILSGMTKFGFILEFMTDAGIAFISLFIISIILFQINNRGLRNAREAIDKHQKLRESLEMQIRDRTAKLETFKSFVDASNQGLGMADIKGNIIFCNKALINLLGLDDELDVVGRKLYDFYSQEEWNHLVNEIFPVVVEKGFWRGVLRLKSLKGETFLTDNDLFLLKDENGQPKFIANALTDITEREKTRQALAEANKKVLETFHLAGTAELATGILHNVGNLLNSVGITSGRVKEGIKQSRMSNLTRLTELIEQNQDNLDEFFSSEKGRNVLPYLKLLSENSVRERDDLLSQMDKLIQQVEHMVEVIRLQQLVGGKSSIKEWVSLASLVQDAIKMEDESMIRHHINLEFNPPELPDAYFDKHRILQILVNLIRNAKHALDSVDPEERLIKIEIRRIALDFVAIDVIDNGIGIKEEHLDKIFEYGFTTKSQGHGFGLHYCINAAKEMGGILYVSSQGEGKGCCFTLEIPFFTEKEG